MCLAGVVDFQFGADPSAGTVTLAVGVTEKNFFGSIFGAKATIEFTVNVEQVIVESHTFGRAVEGLRYGSQKATEAQL